MFMLSYRLTQLINQLLKLINYMQIQLGIINYQKKKKKAQSNHRPKLSAVKNKFDTII